LQLKWPNDVLLNGGKFCGLLLERVGAAVVVGIGVNLASTPRSESAARALAEIGPAPDRDIFAAQLAAQFDIELRRWRQFGLEPILNRWLAAAHAVGSALTVHEPSGARISGTFDGLEPDGALRLRLADGSARVIHAGDVILGGTE
jgi:BirA family biotin operon repressor/biotin-[acetyl-CoA-carboxylase] ligase